MPEISSAMWLAFGAAVGWAVFDLARRDLSARMSAWALVVGVTVGALPLLAIWALIVGDWRLTAAYWLPGLGSVALNVIANFAYFRAFQLSPLSVTLPMLSFTPLFASLLSAAFLGESISGRATVGALLVVAGGLALGMRPGSFRFESGSLVMLAVALFWSAALLCDKTTLAHASPYVHALVLNAGVAVSALVALGVRGRLGELRGITPNGWRLGAAVAVGAAALTVQLLSLGGVTVGVLETLKRGIGGLSAVVCGRWLYAEAITARKVGAILAMTAGVALILL